MISFSLSIRMVCWPLMKTFLEHTGQVMRALLYGYFLRDEGLRFELVGANGADQVAAVENDREGDRFLAK